MVLDHLKTSEFGLQLVGTLLSTCRLGKGRRALRIDLHTFRSVLSANVQGRRLARSSTGLAGPCPPPRGFVLCV